MKAPWSYIKAFERKSFEKSSEETNNTIPKTTMSAELNERAVEDVFPPKIVLQPAEVVVEEVSEKRPTKKPKQKRKKRSKKKNE